MSLPERPRLRASVVARRHVDADGARRVELIDGAAGLRAEIDESRWRLLTFADGTRDLDAIYLACARDGVYAGEAPIRETLEELAAGGLLEDGLPAPTPEAPVGPATPRSPSAAREPLPGYSLRCDGSGSCCRFYGSVAFTRREAMRAELTAAEMELPLELSEAFTPLRGARMGDEPRAVALVEGRCLFLEPGHRCGLHRRGGPLAKPLACRTYPNTYVDDGVAVRISVAPECVCAYESARAAAPSADPALEDPALEDPAPGVPVTPLVTPVPITLRSSASAEALRAWSSMWVERLAAPTDGVRACLSLARAAEVHGLDLAAAREALDRSAEATPERLRERLTRLGEHAREVRDVSARFASSSALSRSVAEWIAESTRDVEAVLALEPGEHDLRDEAFYLRALAHGHRLATEARPMVDALEDRATRMLAARSMRRGLVPDAAARVPLALVEAAMRNLRLRA